MTRPGETASDSSEAKSSRCDVGEAASVEPYQELLQAYLDICNKVLAANRDRFPYRQIWSAGEEALSGRTVILSLHDDVPKAHCLVAFGESHISTEVLAAETLHLHKERLPVHAVRLTYLLDVVAEPDKYVADPSLINWDWIKP